MPPIPILCLVGLHDYYRQLSHLFPPQISMPYAAAMNCSSTKIRTHGHQINAGCLHEISITASVILRTAHLLVVAHFCVASSSLSCHLLTIIEFNDDHTKRGRI